MEMLQIQNSVILDHFLGQKVFGDSKNDFFQKSKKPFLGFGQSNIDSKFQDFLEKSVTSGAFTSWKPSILDHFWAEKVFGDSKNDFFQKSKNPFLGFGQSNIDSKFQDFRVKSVALGAFTSSKPFILDHFWAKNFFYPKMVQNGGFSTGKGPWGHTFLSKILKFGINITLTKT